MINSAPSASSPVGRAQAASTAISLVRLSALVLTVAVPLVITPWGTDAYHQPKVLVVYGLSGAMLIGWIVQYTASRRPRWIVTRSEPAVWVFFLALLVSSAFSVNLRLTIFGAPARHEGLLTMAAYLFLFFCGVHFFGSQGGFRSLMRAACAGAALAVVYGVAQAFLPPLFQGEAIARAWYAGLGMPRSLSTIGSPVSFGGYLTLLLPLTVALAVVRMSTLWSAAAGAAVIALLLTFTRAAWLGAAAGLVVLLLLGGSQFRRRPVLLTLGAGLAVGILLLVVWVGTPASVAERTGSIAAVQSGSLASRIYIWTKTGGLILERPWTGWGLETLREVFPYDRPALVRYFGIRPVIIDKAHNDILQVAVSTGIPGALAYLAVWASLFAAALRLHHRSSGIARLMAAGWLAALLGYFVQAQFSFSVVGVAPLVWLLAGAAVGWEATAESSGRQAG